jgi:NAD(P)-dependent dehydrogenase (short-subunit alcohol dehydrogenase family)
MISLAGNIIVVTGGKGLLGKAIVQHVQRAGGMAISADIQLPLNEEGTAFPLDIGNEASIQKCVDDIWKKHGKIDGWVNCAYPRTQDWRLKFEEIPAESLRKNLDMHLGGYILCCRAVLEKMRKRKSGSVVNVASIYGIVGPDFSLYEGTSIETSPAAYGAIKGGLIQMSRYLASYYGKHNLRVNTLSPGGIANNHPPEFAERYAKRTLLGRMATPDDIAAPCVFLLSDGASYVTGHNLVVDGGWTAV